MFASNVSPFFAIASKVSAPVGSLTSSLWTSAARTTATAAAQTGQLSPWQLKPRTTRPLAQQLQQLFPRDGRGSTGRPAGSWSVRGAWTPWQLWTRQLLQARRLLRQLTAVRTRGSMLLIKVGKQGNTICIMFKIKRLHWKELTLPFSCWCL